MKKQIKLTPEQKFLEYLYEITPNEKLREYAAEFFSIFKETYKSKFLRKEDFDTLRVEQPDGSFITYEQDVVRDLFKTRNQVPYDEVYYYLFKNNIKSFVSFYDNFNFKSLGKVNAKNKKISIKYATDLKLKDFYNGNKSENIKSKFFDMNQKATTFHELSHIFEIKTYNNREYCIVGLKDKISNLKENESIIFSQNAGYIDELTKKLLTLNKNCSAEEVGNFYYAQYVNKGKLNIAEIINEDFTLRLLLKNNVFYIINKNPKQKFITKRRYGQDDVEDYEFFVTYHRNYDMLLLLKYALPHYNYKSCRFNSSNTIRQINNLNIDNELINFAINLYKKLALFKRVKNEVGIDIEIKADWGDNFDSSSIYNLIAYGVGFEEEHILENNDFNYKTISQTLLINAIKNKIFDELKDKKVRKDLSYFVKLNNQLTMMDKFLIYKNEPIGNTDIYPFEVYSIEKMSEKYGDSLYCQQFGQMNELMQGIKKYINCLPENKQKTVKSIMKFFETQKQLDDSLEGKIQNADELKQAQILPSPDNSSHKKQNELEPTK